MTAAIAEAIDWVEELAEQVDRRIREFVRIVTELMNDVPGFLEFALEPLRRTMARVHELDHRYRECRRDLLAKLGNPFRLSEVAAAWGDAVANPITGAAAVVAPTKLAGDKRWEGYAADMYRATAAEQLAGLNSIRDLASQLRTSLTAVSHALGGCWLTIGFLLAELLMSVLGAIAAAATGVGAPVGGAALVAALAKAISLIGVAVGAVAVLLQNQEAEQGSIRQKLADVGSEWPAPPTAELSDASVADGDSSDWTPRR